MEELLRPPKEETTRRWKQLEQDLADKLEGWLTIASGSKSDKGDAKSYSFLGECKYRWSCDDRGFYIPFDLQWLEAIWRHAQRVNKTALLALEWGTGDRVCLFPKEAYEKYIGGEIMAGFISIDGRTHDLRADRNWTSHSYHIHFFKIEVPEHNWVIFPWEELSWLRLEELRLREELGRKEVNRLRTSTNSWAKAKFPSRKFK